MSQSYTVTERLRQFAAYGDTAEGRILAQLALTEIERLSGAAKPQQSSPVTATVADIQPPPNCDELSYRKGWSDGYNASLAFQQKPVAMLGGIHGVALIRHIKAMQPEAQKEFHTPLHALVDTSTAGLAQRPLTAEDVYANCETTLIGFRDELTERDIKFICDQVSRKVILALSSTLRHGTCQVCGETADLKCGPSRFGNETWACKGCWEPDFSPILGGDK